MVVLRHVFDYCLAVMLARLDLLPIPFVTGMGASSLAFKASASFVFRGSSGARPLVPQGHETLTGMGGFEPPTTRTPIVYHTKLDHIPN